MRLARRALAFLFGVLLVTSSLIRSVSLQLPATTVLTRAPTTTTTTTSTTTTSTTTTTTAATTTAAPTSTRAPVKPVSLEDSAPHWPRTIFPSSGATVPHFTGWRDLDRLFPDERLKNNWTDQEMTFATLHRLLKIHDAICTQYRLPYSLMMGTMLGALRERSFLAWDHDTDLWIAVDHREFWSEAMRRHLPPDLYLYNKEIWDDWHDGFYKVRDRLTCSSFHNHPMVKLKHGLMIDAFQFSFLLKDDQWQIRLDHPGKYLYYPWQEAFPLKTAVIDGYKMLTLANSEKALEDYYGNWRQPPPKAQQRPKRPYPKFERCDHSLSANYTESEMAVKMDFERRSREFIAYTPIKPGHPLYSCEDCLQWCNEPSRSKCLLDNNGGSYHAHHNVCFDAALMKLCRCHNKRPYYADNTAPRVQFQCMYKGQCTHTNMEWYTGERSCCSAWPFCPTTT